MAWFFVVAMVLVSGGAALAQAPSAQEQAACRGDAQRYCASAIGKPPEMRACLVQNKANLSVACRAVVESRGG